MENIGHTDIFLEMGERCDECARDGTRGLSQEELSQYKNKSGDYTATYYLIRAKTMLNKLRKDFALSPWTTKGYGKVARQKFEKIKQILVDIEEVVRLFEHTVEIKEDFQVVNKQPTVMLTTFTNGISVSSGSDLFAPCIEKVWKMFEEKENLEHFATVKRNSLVLVDFFKKLAEKSDDADVKIQAERIYLSIEKQLEFIFRGKSDYDLRKTGTEIKFIQYVKGE